MHLSHAEKVIIGLHIGFMGLEINMKVTYCSITDKGDRINNEDSIAAVEWKKDYCFVVADGLGGHEKGEAASKLVTDTAVELFKKEGFSEFFLREAFEIGQERLIARQIKEKLEGDMKTTLVILGINDREVNWGHIGDSRLYHFQNKKIIKHTYDHSVPQMLVNIGEIEEKDIRSHPDRSIVLKVMGMEWEHPFYEIGEPVASTQGQSFLLCTDGFWENIEDEEMVMCLKKSKSVYEWISYMEEIVVRTGKNKEKDMDNYSAVGVWIR